MNALDKSLLHPRYWLIWLAYALLRAILLLPYPWIQKLGLWLGYKLAPVIKGRRRVVEVNIGLCFPDIQGEEKTRLVDDIMANNILGFFETAYGWWGNDAVIKKHSKVEGLEHIHKAQQEGRGILLIGAHFTTLDLSGRVMTLREKADVTYRKQNNPLFNYLINHGRSRIFTHLIEKREMRKMIRGLRKGKMIWYATDQDFGRKNSVFAPFFDVPTATLTSISDLIRMTGAKPLFYSCNRVGKGKDTMYIGTVSDPFEDKFSDDNVANATLLNKALEDSLKQDPSQYMWVHRRFKTRPDPESPSFYAKK
ncbi:MAG: LpxL/LpxP family Kdo(2)-lipid IV(A) lauroyl/palmitoleoyl acyltransferase [Pseudomonadales bacterium]|nr:LpxL/LpxP family Kdo(2)-lipid IV(A) lauroyl/palmitoleoyl acyltransferase [Pseudomonadales bacterium]